MKNKYIYKRIAPLLFLATLVLAGECNGGGTPPNNSTPTKGNTTENNASESATPKNNDGTENQKQSKT